MNNEVSVAPVGGGISPELCRALEEGGTLVTATSRLSRYMRQSYDGWQQARGRRVWSSADILPWGAWVRRAWEEGAEAGAPVPGLAGGPPPVLLSGHQEQVVWEAVVAAGRGGAELLRPAAAAELAAAARGLLESWRLELPAETGGGRGGAGEGGGSEETRAFARWNEAFNGRCADSGWVTFSALPGLVAGWVVAGRLPPPQPLFLAGFDEFTPAQLALLGALRGAGCPVTELEPPERRAETARLAFDDAAEEIAAAARWARGLAEGGAEGLIGVVGTGLSAQRELISRIFSEVLEPGALLAGERGAPPFNISEAPPLADYPLVGTALALLELGRRIPPVEQLGALLRSPFLAGAESELSRRALLDARLRRFGEPEPGMGAVLRTAGTVIHGGQAAPFHSPRLAGLLEGWREALGQVRNLRLAPSGWVEHFRRLLNILGWPGERTLDTVEHQARLKFLETLAELAGLDLVAGGVTYGEALTWLTRMVSGTPFQPEGVESRIQVLGELEAGGMAFEGLWIMGLHDEVWPRPPRPNPFLPAGWQRAHGMPHSSAGRELSYARRVTSRLLSSAGRVLVSHPLREGDRELRPSPLISAIGLDPGPSPLGDSGALAADSLPGIISKSGRLGEVDDQRGPPLQGAGAGGGAALFRDQAACPFRAFANHRLHARPLESPTHGLSPAERGDLAHKALERLWGRLGGLDELKRQGEEGGLEALIREESEAAVLAMVKKRPTVLRPRFARIEKERVSRMVGESFKLELQRSPFSVIAREESRSFTIGGLEVNTRIDRVDQLADGRNVIIDYKSGRTNVNSWLGDRPDEPQLPLYCSSGGMEVAAVAFLQLRKGDIAFRGIEAEKGILPKVKGFDQITIPPDGHTPASQGEMMEEWRRVLEGLAEAFRAGEAQVDPKKKPTDACRYCELIPLCRLHEQRRRRDICSEESED